MARPRRAVVRDLIGRRERVDPNLMDTSATYPIAGDTGRYAGARGTITIADAGKNRSLATVRY